MAQAHEEALFCSMATPASGAMAAQMSSKRRARRQVAPRSCPVTVTKPKLRIDVPVAPRLALDHHDPLGGARGGEGVSQADDLADDGQIEGSWHGLGQFSQKNNRGTY